MGVKRLFQRHFRVSNIKSRAQSRLSCVYYWFPRHSIKMILRLGGSYAGVSLHVTSCVAWKVEVIFMVARKIQLNCTLIVIYSITSLDTHVKLATCNLQHFLKEDDECMLYHSNVGKQSYLQYLLR